MNENYHIPRSDCNSIPWRVENMGDYSTNALNSGLVFLPPDLEPASFGVHRASVEVMHFEPVAPPAVELRYGPVGPERSSLVNRHPARHGIGLNQPAKRG